MERRRVEDPEAHKWLKEKNAIVTGHLSADEGSVIFVNDQGQRYRLPRSSTEFKASGLLGPERLDREVATERDLFNAFGILYELPADNAGGFGRIRPIATHGRRISDFCSYRGLLVLSGLSTEAPADNKHIIRSDDGKTALWVGAIDDLWRLGKPHGTGGPWKRSQVKAGEPSDPFLIGGFDLRLRAGGDLHVDAHHTVEDVGLALGRAFDEALGARRGIARMAGRTVPLDAPLGQVGWGLGGRPSPQLGPGGTPPS